MGRVSCLVGGMGKSVHVDRGNQAFQNSVRVSLVYGGLLYNWIIDLYQ
jgi:hypothetical protein